MKKNISGYQMDFWLLMSILFLLGLGTVMVFSASTATSYMRNDSSTAYDILKDQIIYAVMGIIVMLVVAMVSYKIVYKAAIILFLVSNLMLVLVPLIGVTRNNAKRWINLGFTTFQPSEIYKIGVILFLAYIFSSPKWQPRAVSWWGFIIYVPPLIPGLLLLAGQPHISCVAIILGVTLLMMFAGGVKKGIFITMIVAMGCAIVAAVLFKPYILQRFLTFLHPESDPTGDGYQILQSLYAIGSGGFFGLGLGRSVQKYLYLPEPYNDFIFSILAEELGFIGVITVLALFSVFIWRGYKIAAAAEDKFASYTAFGITSLISIQVAMNVAVVTSSMPVTGISLPFFSYGGTSLMIMMASMGILLNISRQTKYPKF